MLAISGATAANAFAHEAGGHRWQRVPPTERRGRTHTSTITVAVLEEPIHPDLLIAGALVLLEECVVETARGHGKGGQNRNKLETAVTLTHKATGTKAYCQSERSLKQNTENALRVLRARVYAALRTSQDRTRGAARKGQVGTGMRGDKRRTIRVRDGYVTDHILNRRWPLDRYLEGDWP